MFQILLNSYQRSKGQKFFSFLLHAEKEGHEGSLGKCVKQILIENEIQVGQKAGFETPDIVANYSSYCIYIKRLITQRKLYLCGIVHCANSFKVQIYVWDQ